MKDWIIRFWMPIVIDHLRDYCDCENPQVYSRGQSGLVGRIRKNI